MIRQFDVFRNPIGPGRDERPYLLVVQHNRLSDLPTRVLVPLVVRAAAAQESRLSPQVAVRGKTYFVDPTNVVTLRARTLGQPVANLGSDRDRIIAALDLVFLGI